MDNTNQQNKIGELESKIKDLATKAETAEGDEKQKLEAELASVKKDKEMVEHGLGVAQSAEGELENAEAKAGDGLSGLHL